MTEITANTDRTKIHPWKLQAPPVLDRQDASRADPKAKYHLGVPAMTELSAEREPNPVNPAAFIFSIVAVPLATAFPGLILLVTIGMLELNLGLVMLFGYILVGATIVGGLPYLLIGIPGLLYALRTSGRHAPFGRFALLGHVCSLPVVFLTLLLFRATDEFWTTVVYGMLGSAFAPLWGTLFAMIYFAIAGRGGAVDV